MSSQGDLQLLKAEVFREGQEEETRNKVRVAQSFWTWVPSAAGDSWRAGGLGADLSPLGLNLPEEMRLGVTIT